MRRIYNLRIMQKDRQGHKNPGTRLFDIYPGIAR